MSNKYRYLTIFYWVESGIPGEHRQAEKTKFIEVQPWMDEQDQIDAATDLAIMWCSDNGLAYDDCEWDWKS